MLSSQLVITMVKEVSLAVRNQAIGMLKAGQTQKSVAIHFGTNVRTVRRWWSRAYCGNSLENRQGRGRKPAIGKVPKIVIAKTLGKKMKSTRKISQLLKYKGFQVSHVTVHTYLRQNLGVKPYKPQLQPKLTEKQKFARLTFFVRHEKNGQLMIGAMYFFPMNLHLSCTIHRIGRTTEFGQQTEIKLYLRKK